MKTTTHPASYLDPSGNTTQTQILKLIRDANLVEETPEGIKLRFNAASIRDDRAIIITIHPDLDHYSALPRPRCICKGIRNPLQCQCRIIRCPKCEEISIGLEYACTHGLCLNDSCPACQHVRECCHPQETISKLKTPNQMHRTAPPSRR